MLDQMEKPSHVKGDRYCQYCDNYLPRAHYPARHRFRVVPAIGAQRIKCPGFIHCEAIPNDSGGITLKWTCDACSYTQTEELFEEIEATHMLVPFAAGERIITQTMLDDAGPPPAPGESLCEQTLQRAYEPRPEIPAFVLNEATACIKCHSLQIQINAEPKFIFCTNCGHSAETTDPHTDWPDILKLWLTH